MAATASIATWLASSSSSPSAPLPPSCPPAVKQGGSRDGNDNHADGSSHRRSRKVRREEPAVKEEPDEVDEEDAPPDDRSDQEASRKRRYCHKSKAKPAGPFLKEDQDRMRAFWAAQQLNQEDIRRLVDLGHKRSFFRDAKELQLRLSKLGEVVPGLAAAKLAAKAPMLLTYRQPTGRPLHDWRMDHLQQLFPNTDIAAMVRRTPKLLTLNAANLAANVRAVKAALGVKDDRVLAKAAARAPFILYRSPDTLRINRDKLQALLRLDDVLKVWLRFPAVLAFSPDTLARKHAAFLTLFAPIVSDPPAVITSQPSLLSMKPESVKHKVDVICENVDACERNAWPISLWGRVLLLAMDKLQRLVYRKERGLSSTAEQTVAMPKGKWETAHPQYASWKAAQAEG